MEQQNQVEFSIIVPIYKVEVYLHQCIDSILGQTYANFELILVDDGSPDNCGIICDEYASKDSRIKTIHKQNGGLVSARKAGVKEASGIYILNVDGDDYIGSDLLQKLHNIIIKHAPDMIAFGFTKICNDGAVLEVAINEMPEDRFYITSEPKFYHNLIYNRGKKRTNYGTIFPSVCLKVIKREIIVAVMQALPDEIAMGEDVAATNQALCNCKTVYVASITEYYYRLNENSMTNTFRRDMMKKWQILFEFMNTHMEKIPQENKDAYACMQIITHIAGAARNIESYGEFSRYIKAEMTPELHEIVDRCKIPKLPLKQKIVYRSLKWYWYWAFWLKSYAEKNIRRK